MRVKAEFDLIIPSAFIRDAAEKSCFFSNIFNRHLRKSEATDTVTNPRTATTAKDAEYSEKWRSVPCPFPCISNIPRLLLFFQLRLCRAKKSAVKIPRFMFLSRHDSVPSLRLIQRVFHGSPALALVALSR